MILVDSSVWIDFFAGNNNAAVTQLQALLSDSSATVGAADLVVFEVLRGFRSSTKLEEARMYLTTLPQVELGGLDNALIAADHYRALRAQGYTVRSPIDILLASYCITQGHLLLHRDADFEVLKTFRGLRTWRH